MTFPPTTLSIIWIPDVRILLGDGILQAPVAQRMSVFEGCLPLFP